MNEPIDIEPLEAGHLVLLPGVEYEVVNTFKDNEGRVHSRGEKWKFLGFRITRGFSGHTIFGETKSGEKISFTILSRIKEQSEIFNNFEKYVAGKPPLSFEFIARLNKLALEALDRCEWIKPIPESSEDLFRELRAAWGRAWVGNQKGAGYEEIENDLNFVYEQLVLVLKSDVDK